MYNLFFIVIAFLLMPTCLFAKTEQTNILSSICTSDFLKKNLAAPMEFTPVPLYGDSYWSDSIPEAMRNSYITEAEKYKGTPWESVNIFLFSEFQRNGNRTNYQEFSFTKRKKLATLALGEIMEGKGRFLPDIFNGLFSICEETWWGIPAHYGSAIPTKTKQTLDLFNAQTGGLMAWTYYMFKEPIKKFSPLLEKRILEEISKRILDEAINKKEWWRGAAMNWNPWICSNWLSCILLAEPNREKQIESLQLVLTSLDSFIDKYPQDGGCNEGPHYWDRAAGSLLDCLTLLKKATNGMIDLSSVDKIQSMGAYFCKMNIGNGSFVDFADSSPILSPHVDWFPSALYLKNQELMSLSANTAASLNYFTNPSFVFTRDNFGSISRELSLLTVLKDLKQIEPVDVLFNDAWLPDIEVLTARSIPNSTSGLFLATKGGHNAESHNHNDVGSFIVYADGLPLFIDPGTETYRKETFNDATRYKIWCMQSGYHNLPIINGIEQKNGKRYASSNVKTTIKKTQVMFSLELAQAYPQEANVKSWKREILFKRNKEITITENYQLKEFKNPTEIILMTPVRPDISDKKIIFDMGSSKYALYFDNNDLNPSYEKFELKDEKLKQTWGKQLYRIKLRILSEDVTGKIRYVIKKYNS